MRVVELAAFAQLCGADAEEARQALQRHVLEGARRAVPQFEHVDVVAKRGDGADGLVVELAAVRLGCNLLELLVGQVDLESAVDPRSAFRIGELGEGADLVERQLGHALGNVQSAACSQAVDDGLGERDRTLGCSAGVDVTVVSHSRPPCLKIPMHTSI